jgi:hypothetical protein
MLQGSHFLLFVHLSHAKSKLLELFYHITREVQESLINQAPTKMWRKDRNDTSFCLCEEPRFLTYASEQAPQSLGGMRLPRPDKSGLAMVVKEGIPSRLDDP